MKEEGRKEISKEERGKKVIAQSCESSIFAFYYTLLKKT
jgi:hypothetical protein